MELNCAVVCDLLPLYLEGLCSQETAVLVDAHLAGCQDCQEKYRRMAAAHIPEATAPEAERGKHLDAKKVLKRLRRRWITLLLCALLLLPVTLLSVNQARGAGLSFTAIPHVIQTGAFLSALTDEEYDKAFSLVDVAKVYDSNSTPLYADFADHPLAQYQEIQLGGAIYYVTDNVYQNEYAHYLQDGDEVQFWINLLLFHESTHDPLLIVPEAIMPKIQRRIASDADLTQTLESFLSSFTLIGDGAVRYYMDSTIPAELLTSSDSLFYVLPACYYNQAVRQAKEEIAEMNEFSAGYAALGLEGYQELSRTVFSENLESLAQKGIVIDGWRLTDIYVTDDGAYHITYALKLKKYGQPVTGMSVELTSGKGGVISSTLQGDTQESLPNLCLIRLYVLEWGK